VNDRGGDGNDHDSEPSLVRPELGTAAAAAGDFGIDLILITEQPRLRSERVARAFRLS
jgi:hypothetical protein